jgi:hypothetical protein
MMRSPLRVLSPTARPTRGIAFDLGSDPIVVRFSKIEFVIVRTHKTTRKSQSGKRNSQRNPTRNTRAKHSLTKKLRDHGQLPPADRGALEQESSTQGSE